MTKQLKKYKVVISDYDDTLVGKDKIISKGNLDSINGFINRGGIFVISTGRMSSWITKKLEGIDYHGLISTCNGAEIINFETKEVVYSNYVSNKDVVEFCKYCMANKINGFTYADGKIMAGFINENSIEYVNTFFSKVDINEKMAEYFMETKKESPKLLIYEKPDRIEKACMDLKKLLPDCTIEPANNRRVEINKAGVSKGTSLDVLSSYLNIDIEDMIGVGDSGNDRAMLEKIGLPIVVENGEEELKHIAKVIAPDATKDAIKWVIDNYCI